MKFLYNNVDFILLPYINITQSGVLEMAINFKKPIISSNISYFVKIFDDFKTFGESVNTCNHEIFAKKINDIVINKKNNFFSEDDINQYYNSKDYDILITNLKNINLNLFNLYNSKALFLDRDGVINKEINYLFKIEDFIFNRGIFKLCKEYQKKDTNLLL